MLVSCLPGPVHDALKGKTEALPGQDKPPKWKTVTVRPLTKAQSATLLNAYLARFNKKLLRQMVKQVQAHPLSTNPLFMRTLAEELRLFGVHEELQKRLNHYLTSQTIDDLFERVLQRVEKDCGKKQVKAAMTAIWASRAGLTEKEILGIAGLKPATWAAIRHALDEALVEAGGRITFSHEYLRRAVRDHYLATAARCTSAHRVVADWFSGRPPDARRAQEEPWQLHQLGAHAKLRRVLLDPQIFLGLWEFSQAELLGYWRDHWHGQDLTGDYEKAHPQWIAWRNQQDPRRRRWSHLIAALADAIWEAGRYSEFGAALHKYARDIAAHKHGAASLEAARRDIHCAYYLRQLADNASINYAKRAVRSLEITGSSLDRIEAYLAMAAVLDANAEGSRAQDYLDRARIQLDEMPNTASKTLALHAYMVAWFFFGWADRRSGMPVSEVPAVTIPRFRALVAELEALLGREHRRTLESVDMLVGALLGAECWAEASHLAKSLYLRCYRTFGPEHLQTGFAVGKYGKASLHLDELESAESALMKADEILAKNFPRNHQSRIVFLKPLAEVYERMGRADDANSVRNRLQSETIGQYFYWTSDQTLASLPGGDPKLHRRTSA